MALNGDSISLAVFGQSQRLSTSFKVVTSVEAMRARDRGSGFLRGAALGFAYGAASGVAFGLMMRQGPESVGLGIVFGVAGVPPGAIIGFVNPGRRWTTVTYSTVAKP
ncbi:MAG: hypothetical protein Q8P50_00095 [Bacillota bacterium]|nr:hypothetical protein [Bacillota bacterium]